jgi:hypothetical protein
MIAHPFSLPSSTVDGKTRRFWVINNQNDGNLSFPIGKTNTDVVHVVCSLSFSRLHTTSAHHAASRAVVVALTFCSLSIYQPLHARTTCSLLAARLHVQPDRPPVACLPVAFSLFRV